jgi:hypothetical protein
MQSPRQAVSHYQRSRSGLSAPTLAAPTALTLRLAAPEDVGRITRLAALDSSPPPEPPILTAAVDGEIYVAVSLVDLHTIADPFRRTIEVRAIALARAHQLRSTKSPQARGLRRLGARHRSANRSPRPQGVT